MDLEHFQELNKQTLYLIDSLRCKKKKILCIESCTGGLLSSSITSVENISDIFEMGLISYSNESKISLCKIPERLIIEHGAVSEVVSKLMSEKILNFSKLKPKDLISISSTGISGPKGGTKEKPLGTIFISISHEPYFSSKPCYSLQALSFDQKEFRCMPHHSVAYLRWTPESSPARHLHTYCSRVRTDFRFLSTIQLVPLNHVDDIPYL